MIIFDISILIISTEFNLKPFYDKFCPSISTIYNKIVKIVIKVNFLIKSFSVFGSFLTNSSSTTIFNSSSI